MAEAKIWHNPRCSKSRQGLEYLNEANCEVEIFDYTKNKIDPEELANVIRMSDHPLQDFIRSTEPEYTMLDLSGKDLVVDEFAKIAAQHPKLLQRPIVIRDGKAIIARPTSKIDELL